MKIPMRRNILKHAYLAGVVVLAAISALLSPYNIAALIPTPSPRPNRQMQPMLLPASVLCGKRGKGEPCERSVTNLCAHSRSHWMYLRDAS